MVDRYSMTGHKLYWHLDRVNDWMKGKRIAPLHIDMGITTGCNIACSYCYGSFMNKTNVGNRIDMPLETMKNLLDDCKVVGIKSIALTGEGENMLNKDIYDALVYSQGKVDIGIATNGTILNKDRTLDFLNSLVYLRYNLSAYNREQYKLIHGADMFDRVIENIKYCVKLKKEHNLSVTIGLQMVIIEDNLFDIVNMAKLGKELGVDYLVAKPCSDDPEGILRTPHGKYTSISKLCVDAEKYSTKDYSVIIKWGKLLNEGVMPYKVCRGTPFMISINGRGNVAPCGHLQTDKFKEEFSMGNINNTRLSEIVYSDNYWNIQEKVKKLNVGKDCETNCKQFYINEFCEMLKNPPEHINFP